MIVDYLREMRLKQWYKATIIFAGPLFAGKLIQNFLQLFFAFLAFGLISSTIYILNDIKDLEKDRLHPRKRNRPIASGRISKNSAVFLAFILFWLALYFGQLSNTLVFITAYYLLMIAYMYHLKQIVILDAFTIATGFFLRAIAGCVSIGISITPWFYLTIFFLAIYLAFCKRLSEIKTADINHKDTLKDYANFIEIAIAISGALSLAIYVMYVAIKSGILVWSVPFTLLGLLLHLKNSIEGNEVHDSLNNPWIIFAGLIFLGIVILATI